MEIGKFNFLLPFNIQDLFLQALSTKAVKI